MDRRHSWAPSDVHKYIHPYRPPSSWMSFVNVHLSAETAKMTETQTPSITCPKCGTVKNSGKRSCCASGGAWIKKCGDAGLEHTWIDGIEA